MAEPNVVRPNEVDPEIEPLLYPCNKLAYDAPLRWLKLGWQDLKRAPVQSLSYGLGLVLFGYLILEPLFFQHAPSTSARGMRP